MTHLTFRRGLSAAFALLHLLGFGNVCTYGWFRPVVISIAFDGVLAFVPIAKFRPPSCKCVLFAFRKGARSSHVDNSHRCSVACLTFLAATSAYWLPPMIAEWLVAAAGVDYWYSIGTRRSSAAGVDYVVRVFQLLFLDLDYFRY